MHPILPFYSFFMLFAIFGFSQKDHAERTMLWLASWGAMLVVLVATTFRQIRGDTARYYSRFQAMSDQSFGDLWSALADNALFDVINWVLAQFGTHPLWMILPITLFCILMLRYSLRQMLGPRDTAIAILLYSAYPFFIFYVSSGIKQAIAMALLMQGYVSLYQKRHFHVVVYIVLAALVHTGALIVVPFIFIHYLIWRPAFGYHRAFSMSLAALIACTLGSIIGINEIALDPLKGFLELSSRYDRYDIYFRDSGEFNYQAGFRPDFTAFSFLPFLAAWWLGRKGTGLTQEISGCWLTLYALLACVYQLFAFAPFSDRFASFSWYLIPTIVAIMLVDAGSKYARQMIVLSFALLNIIILQFYTGKGLHVAF